MSVAEVVSSFKFTAIVEGLITGSPGTQQSVYETAQRVFSDGTGANKAGNVLYFKSRSLNNTNEDINFTTALDFQGDAIGAAKIKGLYIKYESGDAGTYLTFKQSSSNGVPNITDAAGHGIKIPVGEAMILTNAVGWTVTASTGDLLNFATSCTATYTLVALVE